jgi:hypothetical protein
MTRVFLTAVTLATFPLSSRAGEAAVRLNLQPMPAPKPALKYQLLPELRELNPGNAAQNYLKCFLEQQSFFYSDKAIADRARYQTMPLAELPVDKLRDYGGYALRQADWAARLDTLDWQALRRIQDGGMEVLPAELGPLQVLARALQVRFRAQVAGQHFDDAVPTAKTMFALSRHLGEHPTEVANLVGLWVAHLGLGTLEEMVQQPKCPNLYWALTDLPCPLVDLRKGVQGDRTMVAAELRLLRDDAPMTEAELETFMGRLSGVLNFAREQVGRPPRSLRIKLQSSVKDPERVSASCRRLVESGCSQDLVKRFSPSQVILLDEKRAFELERDERMMLLALPLWQVDALARDEERDHLGDGLFAELLPQIVMLRRAQGQLEQQIAVLRHVEALRLYAAEHGGKLPTKLADLSVPLPVDPVTGKPFVYTVEGGTAHIRGDSLTFEGRGTRSNVHYEVTLKK